MPEGVDEGILRGLYQFRPGPENGGPRVNLIGSGAILRGVIEAQRVLGETYGVSAAVWSATSYKALRYDAMECERWNMLHPLEEPRVPYVTRVLGETGAPTVAASDYMRLVADQVAPYVPGSFVALGTDGFGRSESRANLRRHFEVDTPAVVVAALHQLARAGAVKREVVARAIKDLSVDAEQAFALHV
jgi:pyruvate dehydrogenase E1 component